MRQQKRWARRVGVPLQPPHDLRKPLFKAVKSKAPLVSGQESEIRRTVAERLRVRLD